MTTGDSITTGCCDVPAASDGAEGLLAQLKAFCLPGGEVSARGVECVRMTQSGEIRSAPNAPWVPFSAEEVTFATRSSFRWEARFKGGSTGWFSVSDSYENGHGCGEISLGGVLPVRRSTGPEFDKGELQRYLSSILLCPPMLLNNRSLIWTDAGPRTLRIGDRTDPTRATVDLEFDEEGHPTACHAERPRMVGKTTVPTPWSATGAEFQERDGLRVATCLESAWHLPEGLFTSFRAHVTSFDVLR
jgi:hypothetical protein